MTIKWSLKCVIIELQVLHYNVFIIICISEQNFNVYSVEQDFISLVDSFNTPCGYGIMCCHCEVRK